MLLINVCLQRNVPPRCNIADASGLQYLLVIAIVVTRFFFKLIAISHIVTTVLAELFAYYPFDYKILCRQVLLYL